MFFIYFSSPFGMICFDALTEFHIIVYFWAFSGSWHLTVSFTFDLLSFPFPNIFFFFSLTFFRLLTTSRC